MRVLSGIQPSGELHLDYFSMMSKMIRYQSENELFVYQIMVL